MRISDWSSDVCSSDLLDRHQAVDAAEFVDNQGHVDARQAHLQQQIEHPHRWRHHQDAPHQVDQVEAAALLALARIVQQVLDMDDADHLVRSEEHTSELQSLMRTSYAVFCLKKKNKQTPTYTLI